MTILEQNYEDKQTSRSLSYALVDSVLNTSARARGKEALRISFSPVISFSPHHSYCSLVNV
jgi:hypothetical protein